MRTTRNSPAPLAPVLAALAFLSFAGSGCRDAAESEGLQAHRAVADRVARAMDDLQKRRASLEPESDIRETLASLNVHKEPPPPAPEPVIDAVAEDPAGDPDGAMMTDAGPAAPPVFRLQGIVWHPTAPLAIVNKHTVGVGESVDGRRVERITREGAVLAGPDGDLLELRLYEPGPKQP
jgi:hypothetical protein